ncbi:MAG: SDR family NAD(P)-dependent oxidoreductase [Leptolyngbyaceae cyanobacterium]
MAKTVLITGAGGGIGRELCKEFKAAGYRVIGIDHPSAPVVENCDCIVSADFTKLCRDTEYRVKIFNQLRSNLLNRSLKALINNAAVQIIQPTENLTVNQWHTTLDINLVAPFLLVQAFLNELTQATGSVVNIASIHAKLTKPSFACYATSKAALVGLTQSLSIDLGGRVRINAIAPAAVSTSMLMAGFDDKPEAFQQLNQMHPVGRIAVPKEIAQAALFLVSDQASFITGAVLEMDGGIRNRLYDPS